MRRGIIIILCSLLSIVSLSLKAQDSPTRNQAEGIDKSIHNAVHMHDSIAKTKVVLADSIIFKDIEFKPNPTKAVIYSAILPGLGQFYNRKYWKLPLVYAGALGLTYAITWNGRVYNDYNQAYRDLVTNSGRSYENYWKGSPDDYPNGGRTGFQSALKRKKDFYRRNRDLAIIAAVGVYALCMIDAYVDAQLYSFDMSPDLSMRVAPMFMAPSAHSKATIGLQCSINF